MRFWLSVRKKIRVGKKIIGTNGTGYSWFEIRWSGKTSLRWWFLRKDSKEWSKWAYNNLEKGTNWGSRIVPDTSLLPHWQVPPSFCCWLLPQQYSMLWFLSAQNSHSLLFIYMLSYQRGHIYKLSTVIYFSIIKFH